MDFEGTTFSTKGYHGFEEILVGPEVAGVLDTEVKGIQAVAEADAATFAVTGHYAGSFESRVEVQPVIKGDPRSIGIVVNTADYSLGVEYGWKGRSGEFSPKAHKTLTRAIGKA